MSDLVFAPIFGDSRPYVEDLWGQKIKIYVRSSGHPDVAAWEREQQRSNPIIVRMMRATGNATGRAMLEAAAEGLDGEELTERGTTLAAQYRLESLKKQAEEFDLQGDEAEGMFVTSEIERAAVVADGWEGVKGLSESGKPFEVPFSRDAAREFFTQNWTIPAEEPRGGESFGPVMAGLVTEKARELGLVKVAAVAAAKKELSATTASGSPAEQEATNPSEN